MIKSEIFSLIELRADEQALRDKFTREATVTDFTKGYVSTPWVNQEIDPGLQHLAAKIITHQFRNDRITKIAGIPNCGIPLATAVSQEMGLPLAPSRKGNAIPGSWKKPLIVNESVASFTTGAASQFVFNSIDSSDHVLLIDDYCAFGITGKALAKAFLEKGVNVSFAFYVAKTFQGGVKEIEKLGIPTFYVVGIKEFSGDQSAAKIILEPPHF